MNKDKPEEMTITDCMKEMTSKESTINAVRELIEFHVNRALEAAAENAMKMSSTKSTILNSYPKENIV